MVLSCKNLNLEKESDEVIDAVVVESQMEDPSSLMASVNESDAEKTKRAEDRNMIYRDFGDMGKLTTVCSLK